MLGLLLRIILLPLKLLFLPIRVLLIAPLKLLLLLILCGAVLYFLAMQAVAPA